MNIVAKYVALDCETGGIEMENTLLTAFFLFLDKDLNEVDRLSLKLKPVNNLYVVTGEGLGINKIDLVTHDKVAVTKSMGGAQLREFLNSYSNDGKTKLVPIGHNIGYDLDFIYAQLLNRREFEKFVSYRKLDTGVIAQFLKAKGDMPDSVSGSLTSLMEYFGLVFTNAHDAEADTRATVKVLREMLNVA